MTDNLELGSKDNIFSASQIVQSPHETFIHRLPVEILSWTFEFVQEVFVKEEANLSGRVSWFRAPSQSSQSVLGAVCKRWRDISLTTPGLWTDIVVDLEQWSNTELRMINECVRRAGTVPLNLTILADEDCFDEKEEPVEDVDDLMMTLRSLADRWNALALQVPWSYCPKLLDNLKISPSIHSFSYIPMKYDIDDFHRPSLEHPLIPKYFYTTARFALFRNMRWDNLQHFEVDSIGQEHLLHIISHAPRLRHCATTMVSCGISVDGRYPIPSTYITNNSLIYLKTSDVVIEHLKLPSLEHLECSKSTFALPNGTDDPFITFTNQSSPPLQTLILDCTIWHMAFNSCLEKLAWITHLSIKQMYDQVEGSADSVTGIDPFLRALAYPAATVILPRLRELKLALPSMTHSSWSLLCPLFPEDSERSLSNDLDNMTVRPLSKVHIHVMNSEGILPSTIMIDRDVFLRLLAVRKSGIDLEIEDHYGLSCLNRIATYYNVDV